MDEKLLEFIDHARAKGMDHATICQLLLSAGWKEKDVAEAFCSRELELPLPEPRGGCVQTLIPRSEESTLPRRSNAPHDGSPAKCWQLAGGSAHLPSTPNGKSKPHA